MHARKGLCQRLNTCTKWFTFSLGILGLTNLKISYVSLGCYVVALYLERPLEVLLNGLQFFAALRIHIANLLICFFFTIYGVFSSISLRVRIADTLDLVVARMIREHLRLSNRLERFVGMRSTQTRSEWKLLKRQHDLTSNAEKPYQALSKWYPSIEHCEENWKETEKCSSIEKCALTETDQTEQIVSISKQNGVERARKKDEILRGRMKN